MSIGKKRLTKGALALTIIGVFLIGWFAFAAYMYSNQILFIDIEGPIYDFQNITLALYQAKLDVNVKGVVIYINTPGGYADSCIEIASYIKSLKESKPVIAVLGQQATSGGYYIASFATQIIAYENTVTGGIGVIATWQDLSEYYQKQGIKIWVWKTGAEKDFGADWRSPTAEENATIQSQVNAIFDKLISDIQSNRHNISSSDLELIKTGQVFSGSEAVRMNLADRIGNIIDSITEVASITGLWKFIIVTPYMDDKEKFLQALL